MYDGLIHNNTRVSVTCTSDVDNAPRGSGSNNHERWDAVFRVAWFLVEVRCKRSI